MRWVKVSGMMMAAHITLVSTNLFAADVGTVEEMSFFEYLGTMVDDNGQWVDPLELTESGALADTAEFSEDADRPELPEQLTEQLPVQPPEQIKGRQLEKEDVQ